MAKKDRFERLRDMRTQALQTLRKDLLSPDRRALLFCLSLWLNARDDTDRQFLQKLIESVWGTPGRIRWRSTDDPSIPADQSNAERSSVAQIKGIFDQMLRE